MSQINPFVACIELARYAKIRGVAFQILPNGNIETSSAEEALELQALILRRKARKQVAPDHGSPKSEELSDDTVRFLYALATGPVTSDEIAQEANISIKSIPPIVRGLNNWASNRGLKLNDLLIRTQKSVKGKLVSTYTMTDKFAEILSPIIGAQKGSPLNGAKPLEEQPRKAGNLALSDLAGHLCVPHGAVIKVINKTAVCGKGCGTADLTAWAASLDKIE